MSGIFYLYKNIFIEKLITKKDAVLKCVGVFALIVLSFLPSLMSLLDAGFYRCLAALEPLMFVLLILSIKFWLGMFAKKLSADKVLAWILSFILLLGGFMAFYNIYFYRAKPSSIEYKYIKDLIEREDLDKYSGIYFILPSREHSKYRYDEFNTPSAAFLSDVRHMTNCVLIDIAKENGQEIFYFDRHMYSGTPVRYFYKTSTQEVLVRSYIIWGGSRDEKVDVDPDILVIDMTKLKGI
jgi:hypothetical protein